jgi:hypothetical protein
MAKQPEQTKTTATVNTAPAADPKFANWKTEKSGFAPYFHPSSGAVFTGIPIGVDTLGKFPRIKFLATEDTECFQGPVESQEAVTVHKGEEFSLALYEGLRNLLNEYFTAGFPVEVHVTVGEKTETANGDDFWPFTVQVEPNCAKKLDAGRADRAAERLKSLASQSIGGNLLPAKKPREERA